MGKSVKCFPVMRLLWASRGRIFIWETAIIATISLFGVSLSFAQSDIKISGHVVDSETAAPIPGAIVTVERLGMSVSSDPLGKFVFDDLPDGHYLLSARRIGYKNSGLFKVEIRSGLSSVLEISLKPEPIKISDQVVSARKSQSLSLRRSGNLTLVSMRPGELKSIEDIIRAVPELELVSSGQQRLLRIRGSQSNGVVVMLDGRPQNSLLMATGDLSSIPLASVLGIEVTRGADYDSPGLAGSVNFITDIASQNDKLSSFAERGSFGDESYSANIYISGSNGIIGGFDFENGFARGDFDYVDPRGQMQTRENNFARYRKLFGQTGYAWRGFSFKLKGRYFDRRAGIPGPVFQSTPYATSCNFEREAYLTADKKIGERYGITADGGFLSRTINYDSPVTPTSFIPYNTSFSERSRDLKIEFNRAGAIGMSGLASIRHETLDGVDHIRPSAGFGAHARDIFATGIGIQIAIPPLKSLIRNSSVTLGLKSESAGNTAFWGPSLTSRLNFDLPARPGIDLVLFRSQRLPNLTDLYWKEDVFATPNPDLKPEKSDGNEIGAEISPISSWQTNFRVSHFETRYENIIIWRKWGGDKFKPVNLSSAIVSGWEFSASFMPFAGPFTIAWSGNYPKPLNRESNTVYYGKYLTFRPIASQRAAVELKTVNIKTAISGRYIGRRYMTEENTKSLSPVEILDFSIQCKYALRGLEITPEFCISNITDKQYEILERNPEKPREFMLRLEVSKEGK